MRAIAGGCPRLLQPLLILRPNVHYTQTNLPGTLRSAPRGARHQPSLRPMCFISGVPDKFAVLKRLTHVDA
jgi:hypothetical protein